MGTEDRFEGRENLGLGSPDLVLVDGEVSQKETAVKAVEAALQHLGGINMLVNYAGIFIPEPFTDYTEEDFNLS